MFAAPYIRPGGAEANTVFLGEAGTVPAQYHAGQRVIGWAGGRAGGPIYRMKVALPARGWHDPRCILARRAVRYVSI